MILQQNLHARGQTQCLFSVFLEQSLVDMHESEKMIAMKVEQLQARIKWLTAVSAAGGAVPIPGFSALLDIPLVLRELEFQRRQLQIDEATMQKHAETFGPEFKDQLRASFKETVKLYVVGFTAESLMKLVAVSAGPAGLGLASHAKMVASEVAQSTLVMIPIVGLIVGSTAGAALSAAITYRQLTTALQAHKEIALNTTQVVTELRVRARSGIN